MKYPAVTSLAMPGAASPQTGVAAADTSARTRSHTRMWNPEPERGQGMRGKTRSAVRRRSLILERIYP